MTSLDHQGFYWAVPWLCFAGWGEKKKKGGESHGGGAGQGVLHVSQCPVLLRCVLSKACLVSEH